MSDLNVFVPPTEEQSAILLVAVGTPDQLILQRMDESATSRPIQCWAVDLEATLPVRDLIGMRESAGFGTVVMRTGRG